MGVMRKLNRAEISPEIIGLRFMENWHVFMPAIMKKARRIAVIEILLLRTPGRCPGLDHLFLGRDVEPGPDLDSLHGFEFIAVTAADNVDDSRTRSATEQRRLSGSDEPVGQVERFTLDQLSKMFRASGCVYVMGAQNQSGFHDRDRNKRWRKVDNGIDCSKRFANGAGYGVWVPRVEVRGQNFRAPKAVAHRRRIGECHECQEEHGLLPVAAQESPHRERPAHPHRRPGY